MTSFVSHSFDLTHSPLDGTHLIEACAGTGKTYAMAFLVLRLIVEKELKIGEILVLTYTNNATDELRDRIRSFLLKAINVYERGEKADPPFSALKDRDPAPVKNLRLLKDALRDFDEAAVHTIHSFCHRVLRDHAFESIIPLGMEIEADDLAVRDELFSDFWRRFFYRLPPETMAVFEKSKISYRNLRTLAARLPRDPMTIFRLDSGLPDPPKPEELRRLFLAAKTIWNEEKPALEDKLRRHLGKEAENAIFKWDIYFSGESALPLPSLKKEKTLSSSHLFFQLLEELEREKGAFEEKTQKYINTLIARLHAAVIRELPLIKRRRRLLAFDDLLLELYRPLMDPETGPRIKEAVRKKYRAALVDEFQDTDPIQYEIIYRLFGDEGSILFFIGDPRQAIYGFRGADLFTYIEAQSGMKKIHTLNKNYRAAPDLLKAINALFSKHPNPFVFPEVKFLHSSSASIERPAQWPADFSQAPLQLWYFGRNFLPPQEAQKNKSKIVEYLLHLIAQEIKRLIEAGEKGEALLDGRPLAAGDITILVRDRYEAKNVHTVLKRYGIKSIFNHLGPLFKTEEAEECLRILKAILELHRSDLVNAALATVILGKKASEIASDEGRAYFTFFHRLRLRWEEEGFLPMFRTLLREMKVRERCLSLKDGERRLTNILHLAEVLHQKEAEEDLTPAGLVKWLKRRIEDETGGPTEYELRLESDERTVKISTVHGAKGLEFPIVFCPFLWKERKEGKKEPLRLESIHERIDGSWRRIVTLKDEEYKDVAWRERLAEECRFLYVALTRAVYRTYLVWGCVSSEKTPSLAYLLHYRKEDVDLPSFSEFMDSLTEQKIEDDLKALEESSDGTIKVHFVSAPEVPEEKIASKPTPINLTVRRPASLSERMEMVASFTFFTSRHLEERDDLDTDLPSPINVPPEKVDPIFLFPPGPRAGFVIHRIMERLDYMNVKREKALPEIVESLKLYGFSPDWGETLWQMTERVLKMPLKGVHHEFFLNQIKPEDRITEMAFTLPLKKISVEVFSHLFQHTPMASYLLQLNFEPTRGFLRGFIDLVFRHDGRYYLLDWKTNHLGYDFADYVPDRLTSVMRDHFYLLQYHLYLLALHIHLQKVLPDYDYEKHMGGAFYLFVRGVNPDLETKTGLFYDRPSFDMMKNWEQTLLSGES